MIKWILILTLTTAYTVEIWPKINTKYFTEIPRCDDIQKKFIAYSIKNGLTQTAVNDSKIKVSRLTLYKSGEKRMNQMILIRNTDLPTIMQETYKAKQEILCTLPEYPFNFKLLLKEGVIHHAPISNDRYRR